MSNLLRHVINIYIYKLYYSVHLCHITPADHSHSHPICLPFKCVLSSTLLTMHHGFKTITSQYNLRDGPNHSNPFCLPHLWSTRAPAAVVWKNGFSGAGCGQGEEGFNTFCLVQRFERINKKCLLKTEGCLRAGCRLGIYSKLVHKPSDQWCSQEYNSVCLYCREENPSLDSHCYCMAKCRGSRKANILFKAFMPGWGSANLSIINEFGVGTFKQKRTVVPQFLAPKKP